jgi:hypothetical protein
VEIALGHDAKSADGGEHSAFRAVDLVHTVAFSHGPSFTSARQVEFAFGPRWAVSGAVGYRSDKLANHPRDRLTVNTCEV